MVTKGRRRRLPVDRRTSEPSETPRDRRARPRFSSATAVAAEALRTGVVPATPRGRREVEIPHEDDTLRVGDPDESPLAVEFVGDDAPGGSSPTPDQNNVDDIGRAYGLQEEDEAGLRSGAEVLGRRDRHRSELTPPRRRRV